MDCCDGSTWCAVVKAQVLPEPGAMVPVLQEPGIVPSLESDSMRMACAVDAARPDTVSMPICSLAAPELNTTAAW